METKKIKNRTELVVFIAGVLAVLVVINYFADKWFGRIDMTEGREYSISPATKSILKHLDDIIDIKVYFSKNLPPNVHQTVVDVKDLLSEYKAYAGKNLKITWEDPGTNENAKREARALGIPEVQMQTFEKDKAQVINAYLGIAVLFGTKKEALPVIQNLQNLEYDLTLAIMKVSRTSTPEVGILKADTMPYLPPNVRQQMNMQDQTEQMYGSLYQALRQNYEVQTVDVSNGTPIDSSIKTLIVPDAHSYTDRKLFEIDQFFMKGGNLIVLADPVKVEFQYGVSGTVKESKLYDLLEHYGVRVNRDLVLDASCGQVQIPQNFGPFSMNVAVPYPYFVRVGRTGFNAKNPAVAPLSEVVYPWVSSLSLLVNSADSAKTPNQSSQDNVTGTVLMSSSEKSWTATGYFNLNPQQKWAPPGTTEPHTLMAYLNGNFKSYFEGKTVPPVKDSTKDTTLSKIKIPGVESFLDKSRTIVPSNKNGHLVVVGDQEFVNSQNATQGNLTVVLNLVDWLTLDDNLITIRTRSIKDRTIDADLLKQGSAKPAVIRIVNIALMPVLLIIVGLVIYARRREIVPVTQQTASLSTSDKTEGKSK